MITSLNDHFSALEATSNRNLIEKSDEYNILKLLVWSLITSNGDTQLKKSEL